MPQQGNHRIYRSRKEMMLNNFLGGIAWGLGITIGLSIILALLDYVFHQIRLVPIIGSFVVSIVHYVKTHAQLTRSCLPGKVNT